MSSSAFTPSSLTIAGATGTAGRNYLSDWNDGTKAVGSLTNALTASGNRTSGQTGWGASSTSLLTLAQNTTSPLRQTSDYKLTHVAVGAAFIESPMFSIDQSDLSKSVSVSFDMTGNVLSGDYDVVAVRYNSAGTFQEVISIAGTASSGTPASALLPTGTTTFRGFFITSNTQTDLYSIRIRRLSGTATSSPQIDTLFVGPQSLGTGAIVTDPIAYTPSNTQGFGTLGSSNVQWRRVGGFMHISGRFVTGTVAASQAQFGLPSGVTVGQFAGQSGIQAVGSWTHSNGNASSPKRGVVLATPGQNYLNFGLDDFTNNINSITPQNGNVLFFSANLMEFVGEIVLPIAEWGTSNVTTAERAVEEYAYNTSTTDADDTTSFGYGLTGVDFGSFTVARSKRVRFTTPILPTDRLSLEFKRDGQWIPIEACTTQGTGPYFIQGTTTFGMAIEQIAGNSTDVTVRFGQYRNTSNATYGGAGNAWSFLAGGTAQWRVRKVSGGAQVGFPIAPANITLINSADNYAGNTRLGLMQYQHGTTYNGGNAPTITLTSGGGSLTSVIASIFIPYQTSDGSWRLKFNAAVTVSALSRANLGLSVNGIVSKSTTSFYQAISATDTGNVMMTGYTSYGNSNIMNASHSAFSTTFYSFSGDIQLESKPTWAY